MNTRLLLNIGGWITLVIGWLYSLGVLTLTDDAPEWANRLAAHASFGTALVIFTILLATYHRGCSTASTPTE